MFWGQNRTRGLRLAPVGLALAAGLVATTVALGAAGDLDTAFNGTGKVTTSFGSGDDYGNAALLQTWDEKVIVAGSTYNGSNDDFALSRYLKNGQLDNGWGTNGFGGGGRSVLAIGAGNDEANAIVAQANHKIATAGTSYANTSFDFELARFNKDGRVDTPFGTNGKVRTSFGNYDDVALALWYLPVNGEEDFRLLAAGYSSNGSNYDFAIAKYKRTGIPDETFSGNGRVRTAIGPGDDVATGIALTGSAKPILSGYSYNGSNDDFAIVRYNTGGNLDPTFGGGDGIVTTPIGPGDDRGEAMVQQPSDGRDIVAGYSYNGSSNDFAVVRYTKTGALDPSFGGGDGIVTTSFGPGSDQAFAVTLSDTGKIVVSGRSYLSGQNQFAIARYNSDGTIDTSFGGGDGMVTVPIGSTDDTALGVISLPNNGKVVSAGYSYNGSTYDFALTRLKGN